MKFVLALLAICMAFQTISATPANNLNDVNLVDIVKVLLKYGVDVSDKLVTKVDGFFTKYTSNQKEENDKVVKVVEDIGQTIAGEIFYAVGKLFDDLEPTANENGKKAMTCIRNEKQQVFTAVKQGVDDITGCILTTVPTLVEDGSDLLEATKAIVDILKAAEVKLENCNLGQLCLVQLLSDLAQVSKEGSAVSKGLEKLIGSFVEDVSAWGKCFTSEKVNILKSVVDIFDETVTCIDA